MQIKCPTDQLLGMPQTLRGGSRGVLDPEVSGALSYLD